MSGKVIICSLLHAMTKQKPKRVVLRSTSVEYTLLLLWTRALFNIFHIYNINDWWLYFCTDGIYDSHVQYIWSYDSNCSVGKWISRIAETSLGNGKYVA